MNNPFLYYLIAVNLALFLVMGFDKRAARRQRRRVPETTLLFLAVIGGSIGGIAGMLLFRHKTRKQAFSLGFPAILLCQAALGVMLWLR